MTFPRITSRINVCPRGLNVDETLIEKTGPAKVIANNLQRTRDLSIYLIAAVFRVTPLPDLWQKGAIIKLRWFKCATQLFIIMIIII